VINSSNWSINMMHFVNYFFTADHFSNITFLFSWIEVFGEMLLRRDFGG
jgi:hypothetical protein